MLVSDAGRVDTQGQRTMQSIYLVASPRCRGRVVVRRNGHLVIAVATVTVSPLVRLFTRVPSANRGVNGGKIVPLLSLQRSVNRRQLVANRPSPYLASCWP